MKHSDAIIVGAGPAGLACAASMGALGLNTTVLEKANAVGSVWRRHYDRLHLHTDRSHSGLPGLAMPRTYPTYPSRAQVVEYLENYATHFHIQPAFNTTASKIERNGSQWIVNTDQTNLSAPVVVIATGWADFPYRPSWPGSETFRGNYIHSSEYRNTSPYIGKRVLVVGFGKFRRRNRPRFGECSRRYHFGSARPGANPAAGFIGHSDPDLGNCTKEFTDRHSRFHQRASYPFSRWPL